MNTKEKILKSALTLFTQHGIGCTSTSSISQQAGIATGTLFIHFSTKQALVDALYLEIKQKMANILNNLDYNNGSAKAFVTQMTTSVIQYYLDNYDEFLFIEMVENSPLVSEEALTEAQKGFEQTAKVMKQMQEEKKLKSLDPELMKNVIWSLVKTLLKTYVHRKSKTINNQEIDLVWESIRAN